MDGSAPDLGSLRVYDGVAESRVSTTVVEGCWNRVCQKETPDWIGKGRHIKPSHGVRVSNLIKIFDNQSAIYDLGAQLRSVPARRMVMTGGAGEHGRTSEDPTHPKPSAGAVFA
jgi:hypothetical protein